MLVRVKSGKFHRMSVKIGSYPGSYRGRSARAASDGNRPVNSAPLREVMGWMELFEAQWDKHLRRLKQQVESDL